MDAETANVHLGTTGAAGEVLSDPAGRKAGWPEATRALLGAVRGLECVVFGPAKG